MIQVIPRIEARQTLQSHAPQEEACRASAVHSSSAAFHFRLQTSNANPIVSRGKLSAIPHHCVAPALSANIHQLCAAPAPSSSAIPLLLRKLTHLPQDLLRYPQRLVHRRLRQRQTRARGRVQVASLTRPRQARRARAAVRGPLAGAGAVAPVGLMAAAVAAAAVVVVM